MTRIPSFLAAAVAVAALATTTPAIAQQRQDGLVNVAIGDITTGDILSDITVNVGAGLNLAANVCGVSVGVLARQLGQSGVARCETAEQFVDITRLSGAF
jgi:molybdopterin-binding protein